MLNEKVIGEYVYQVSDECKVGVGLFRHVYKRYNEKTKKQEVIKRIDKKQSKGIFEQMLTTQFSVHTKDARIL
ncbi:unnamed protein product [Paramecium octaurelia]|uniref:Uncharacterized protein n=1 Tax=Paramecium octaurelia TaxID=43137 RepID=A0A8S1SVJ1_PAROT|nr:unnamed protein product [Paramecium octaurelia]